MYFKMWLVLIGKENPALNPPSLLSHLIWLNRLLF